MSEYPDLTLLQSIIIMILCSIAVIGLIWPWFSLRKLNKRVGDIAFELRRIREDLEKKNK